MCIRDRINTSSLKSLFKAVYGQPMAAYMKEYRIRIAMELLRQSDEPIAQIAAGIGYESAGKFTRAFPDVAHVLPSEYRKQRCVYETDLEVQDIDPEEDWEIAELKYRRHHTSDSAGA